jgi:hypothetical protein
MDLLDLALVRRVSVLSMTIQPKPPETPPRQALAGRAARA